MMQMPSNGFDIMAASARMDTYSTFHHRRRWPSMDWVWDEMDDLRADVAEDRAALEAERDGLRDALESALVSLTGGDTLRAESILTQAVK